MKKLKLKSKIIIIIIVCTLTLLSIIIGIILNKKEDKKVEQSAIIEENTPKIENPVESTEDEIENNNETTDNTENNANEIKNNVEQTNQVVTSANNTKTQENKSPTSTSTKTTNTTSNTVSTPMPKEEQREVVQQPKEERNNTKMENCTNNSNHFIQVGNCGKWFNTKNEAMSHYENLVSEWSTKWEKGTIDDAEYYKKCPTGYEIYSCALCGKWTINLYYR